MLTTRRFFPFTLVALVADNPFAPFIEELYNLGITGGCQAAPLLYCPDNPNTRGQMAVFLTKTFSLTW